MSPQETYDDLVAQLTEIKESIESTCADSPSLPRLTAQICRIRCKAERIIFGVATDCDTECGIDDDDAANATDDDGSDGYVVEELEEQPDDGENHSDHYMENEAREEVIARYRQRKAKDCGCQYRGGCAGAGSH